MLSEWTRCHFLYLSLSLSQAQFISLTFSLFLSSCMQKKAFSIFVSVLRCPVTLHKQQFEDMWLLFLEEACINFPLPVWYSSYDRKAWGENVLYLCFINYYRDLTVQGLHEGSYCWLIVFGQRCLSVSVLNLLTHLTSLKLQSRFGRE